MTHSSLVKIIDTTTQWNGKNEPILEYPKMATVVSFPYGMSPLSPFLDTRGCV